MAIERNEQGEVKLVISKATWKQLCNMANVEIIHGNALPTEGCPAIMPVGYRSEPTFWVCAAMVLGNADAMMLAAISLAGDGEVAFPGLELF